jgi:electron transfer flavoprotein beta subunit
MHVMNIVVLLKQVHDPNLIRSLLRISEDGTALALPPGMAPIMNGYDANALEEALRLKEKIGGSITAISLGPESAKEILRRALAMGADKAFHVQGLVGPGNDGLTVATRLAAAIRSVGEPDLILAGRSASDTDAGIVAILLAGLLTLPVVTPARSLTMQGDGALVADRITETGVRRILIRGRAVVGVSNEINKPRSPQLKGVAMAKRAVIPTLTDETLGLSPQEPAVKLRLLAITPAPASVAELIAGAPEVAGRALADKLRSEGLI